MIQSSAPFILFDDARGAGAAPARLYQGPVEIIEARDPAQVRESLARLRAAAAQGLHAAGFLSYEAGHALEPRLSARALHAPEDAPPLLWFGLFDGFEEIAAEAVGSRLPDPSTAAAAPPLPLVTRQEYEERIARTRTYISAGDIYQANVTFPCAVHFRGEPLALYAAIRARAGAGYGAALYTGAHWLLSFSPELFFTLEAGQLSTRPMKGTAPRDPSGGDQAAADALKGDAKQRAENLMIVDLLRNDLAKVSKPGSVEVPALFTVETYPTVHQMTSTVTSRIEAGADAIDVLEAIFPCGSITGAPKIRAMEIIAELEREARQVYTGSIGRLAPGGEAAFNVAIRTLSFAVGETHARLGLGSGVVADSRADEEWRECLAKGAFVSEGTSNFHLIETMAFDPRDGIANLDRHLTRMKTSAEVLGFAFDRHHARNELQAATFRFREAKKLRLLLSRSGAITIESRVAPEGPDEPVTVAIVPLPVRADDFRVRHKTSDRGFYAEARERAGTFEVLFVDEQGFLTEGSRTNVFVEEDDMLLTPPLARPLLPGVLREQLIADGHAREADLRPEDLRHGFYIGNAVRGLIEARLQD